MASSLLGVLSLAFDACLSILSPLSALELALWVLVDAVVFSVYVSLKDDCVCRDSGRVDDAVLLF